MSSHNFLRELIDIKTKNSSIDGLDESFAILNLNYSIEYSSHSFNSFFHTDSSLQISFTSLTKLRPQAEKVEKLIKLSIENQLIIKFIYFVVSDNILHAKLFEIRPIINQTTKEIFAIYISTIPYKEYGLIFQGLQQNNASKTFMGIITSFSKRKQKKHIELLTDFQLTICYLVVHNYSNAKIAEIINQLNNDRRRNTTRNTINSEIERIRILYSMPSKEALIEFLNLLNLQSFLPKSIFNEKIIIVE